MDYVFTTIQGLGAITDKRILLKALSNGKCLLIFDGLDEIHSKFRYKFQHDLEVFTDTYSDNLFIMSCRPRNSFVEFNNFTVLYLCPLYFFQTIELVNKLEFRPDEPSIKENFIEDINGLLSESQKEFIENPMLLTIMLITYDYSLSIPEKLHIFYERAYNALSFRHDSNKSLNREFKTKLSPEHFSDYFAEFCARSYTDECYDFDEFTFDNYFHKLNPYLNDNKRVKASDFRDDLIDAMCLMIYEDCRYQFVHRSFQEYFCALCISKQMDEQIEGISFIFEKSENRRDGDLTLDLLYCIIPRKVEKIIILPFLQRLFKKCDQNEGFITFLGEMFDIIEFGNPDNYVYSDYSSSSALYNFIFKLTYLEFVHKIKELPYEDDFVYDKWVRLDKRYVIEHDLLDNIILKKNLPSGYIKAYGRPEIVGNYYVIEVPRLLANRSKYKRIIDSLSSDSCGIKKEYDQLRDYMHDLEKKYGNKPKAPSDDVFDKFIY